MSTVYTAHPLIAKGSYIGYYTFGCMTGVFVSLMTFKGTHYVEVQR